MSRLLELSCNLTGESRLFYRLGLTRLSGTNPTARLGSEEKPGQLRWLDSWLARAPELPQHYGQRKYRTFEQLGGSSDSSQTTTMSFNNITGIGEDLPVTYHNGCTNITYL